MARPAPADEGSPGRLIATMVGIVGILLLGSLAWSAVGALFSAVGETAHALSSSTPAPKLGVGLSTPSPQPSARATNTPQASVDKATPEPTVGTTPTPVPLIEAAPTPSPSGRSPWILLPQPAPGTRVAAGAQVIEVRGRGDTTITAIRLELDGTPLGVSLEQRSESTWRGSSNIQVGVGHHSVKATVVDDQGRSGSYRWTFDAGQ